MTTTDWDYSALAAHYDKRAPYAPVALDALVAALALPPGAPAADIGAGTGRLALPLSERGLDVTAVEPNDAMRAIGRRHERATLRYVDATGEATGLSDGAFALVAYGSSFNVLDPARALREAVRLLCAGGAIALMWNHRDLDDPLQDAIERAIHRRVPDYAYGTRRADPSAQIEASGAFGAVRTIEHRFRHRTSSADFLDGFRAHATLLRQAGDARDAVLADIAALVGDGDTLAVPFATRIWYARRTR